MQQHLLGKTTDGHPVSAPSPSPSRPTLSNLPSDIILSILSHLSLTSLSHLSSTSHNFNSIVQQHGWRSLLVTGQLYCRNVTRSLGARPSVSAGEGAGRGWGALVKRLVRVDRAWDDLGNVGVRYIYPSPAVKGKGRGSRGATKSKHYIPVTGLQEGSSSSGRGRFFLGSGPDVTVWDSDSLDASKPPSRPRRYRFSEASADSNRRSDPGDDITGIAFPTSSRDPDREQDEIILSHLGGRVHRIRLPPQTEGEEHQPSTQAIYSRPGPRPTNLTIQAIDSAPHLNLLCAAESWGPSSVWSFSSESHRRRGRVVGEQQYSDGDGFEGGVTGGMGVGEKKGQLSIYPIHTSTSLLEASLHETTDHTTGCEHRISPQLTIPILRSDGPSTSPTSTPPTNDNLVARPWSTLFSPPCASSPWVAAGWSAFVVHSATPPDRSDTATPTTSDGGGENPVVLPRSLYASAQNTPPRLDTKRRKGGATLWNLSPSGTVTSSIRLSPSSISRVYGLSEGDDDEDGMQLNNSVYALCTPSTSTFSSVSPSNLNVSSTILTGWYDGQIRIYDLRSPTIASSPSDHYIRPCLTLHDPFPTTSPEGDPIYSLCMGGGGGCQVVAGTRASRTVKIWDVRKPDLVGRTVFLPSPRGTGGGGEGSPVYSLRVEHSRVFVASGSSLGSYDDGDEGELCVLDFDVDGRGILNKEHGTWADARNDGDDGERWTRGGGGGGRRGGRYKANRGGGRDRRGDHRDVPELDDQGRMYRPVRYISHDESTTLKTSGMGT